MTDGVTFEPKEGRGAAEARPAIEDLYRRAYTQRIASGDPFGTPEEFMRRFDSYAANPAFTMVLAVLNDGWIGQAWGWPLTAETRWWTGLMSEPEPGFTVEDGTRTFALSEIMVDQIHTGRGLAHALHDRLLADRPETRATLLVNPANERARTAYLRWGWHPVAALQPGLPHAPILDVLIRPLPA